MATACAGDGYEVKAVDDRVRVRLQSEYSAEALQRRLLTAVLAVELVARKRHDKVRFLPQQAVCYSLEFFHLYLRAARRKISDHEHSVKLFVSAVRIRKPISRGYRLFEPPLLNTGFIVKMHVAYHHKAHDGLKIHVKSHFNPSYGTKDAKTS